MTPRFVEIPMARARAHLAQARYPQAIGAFRAALALDPTLRAAHLGLADALAAQGRRHEAVEGLVGIAEACVARDEPEEALALYGRALDLDPSRTALHLDLAMVEETMGQHDAAVRRVEGLAEGWLLEGRTDEAAELLRFLATWDEDADETPVAERVAEPSPERVAEPSLARGVDPGPLYTALITGHTVIARNPLLPALELVASAPGPAPIVELQPEPVPEPIVELEPIDEPERIAAPDAQTVVLRAPSAPIAVAMEAVDPESDMVTRIADVRRLAAPPKHPRAPSPPRAAPPVNPVVERLRARAGLRQAPGRPRHVTVRATEPISIRPALRVRPEHEEDVTVRYRRPRPLYAAS